MPYLLHVRTVPSAAGSGGEATASLVPQNSHKRAGNMDRVATVVAAAARVIIGRWLSATYSILRRRIAWAKVLRRKHPISEKSPRRRFWAAGQRACLWQPREVINMADSVTAQSSEGQYLRAGANEAWLSAGTYPGVLSWIVSTCTAPALGVELRARQWLSRRNVGLAGNAAEGATAAIVPVPLLRNAPVPSWHACRAGPRAARLLQYLYVRTLYLIQPVSLHVDALPSTPGCLGSPCMGAASPSGWILHSRVLGIPPGRALTGTALPSAGAAISVV